MDEIFKIIAIVAITVGMVISFAMTDPDSVEQIHLGYDDGDTYVYE